MKLSLLITTYERPDYLYRCLESLKTSGITKDIQVLIVDDNSKDERVIQFASDFCDWFGGEYSILKKEPRSGICQSLSIGYERLFKSNDYVINLDADAIVSENFFEVIKKLIEKNPNKLITGFNSLTKNNRGSIRHGVVSTSSDGYVLKKSCGGINLVTNKANYTKYIKPALDQINRMRSGNWDEVATRNYSKDGNLIVCASPSIVQHIGFDSSMGHNDKPCYAQDFPDEQKKTIIINQFFGLGDIIFCMAIAEDYVNRSHKVVWPIESQFMGIQKHFPQVTFIDKGLLKINYEDRTETVTDTSIIIPLRWSQNNLGLHVRDCMKSKYQMFGRDWNEWRQAGMIRFGQDENRLSDLLGIKDGEPYIVVNRNFKTSIKRIPIEIKSDLRVIEMNPIEGFTMIDWSLILENATEIHTVSTSIIYLLEVLDLKGTSYIYKREPEEKSHDNYSYILTDRNKYVLK